MSEFSTGKSIIVLAIVVGCFAILWPKIFYPMFQAALSMSAYKHDVGNVSECKGLRSCFVETKSTSFLCGIFGTFTNDEHLLEQIATHGSCKKPIKDLCGFDIDALLKSSSSTNQALIQKLRSCHELYNKQRNLHLNRTIYFPRRPPHHMHPGGVAQSPREGREKERIQLREGRPFPHPSARQPAKPIPKSNGSMGILMPVYTIAIIVFFLYTILKLVTKKPPDEKPMVKDFHMDPEYRKFVLSEQYDDSLPGAGRVEPEKHPSPKKEQNFKKEDFDVKPEDYEIYQLRKKLQETEAAMERIMKHMGVVSECLASSVATPSPSLKPRKAMQMEKSDKSSNKGCLQKEKRNPKEEVRPSVRPQQLLLEEDSYQNEKDASLSSPDPESYELIDPSPSSPMEILDEIPDDKTPSATTVPTLLSEELPHSEPPSHGGDDLSGRASTSSPDIEVIPSDDSPSLLSLEDTDHT